MRSFALYRAFELVTRDATAVFLSLRTPDRPQKFVHAPHTPLSDRDIHKVLTTFLPNAAAAVAVNRWGHWRRFG